MTKLSRFSIEEFQSFYEPQEIVLHDHLTLIAGRNNVGKSALLRALQLPVVAQEGARAGCKVGYDICADRHDLERAYPQAAMGDEGSRQVLDWLLSFAEDDLLTLRARYWYTGELQPTRPEGLTIAEMNLPEIGVRIEGKVGTQLGWTGGPFEGGALGVRELETFARSTIANVLYLGPRRVEQGRRHLRPSRELLPDARNLSDVLLRLQLNDLPTFERVRSVMQQAFPEIENLSMGTADDEPSAVAGEPELYFAGRPGPIPLRLCGSGIEQMLALGVGILTAPSPRLILIDEPQAYLHPHAERSLLSLLDEHPEHQYVVASHSHMLLRARGVDQVRLLHLRDGATTIMGDAGDAAVLAELGVSAADLWLNDKILWVEGPTEEEVLRPLAEKLFAPAQLATLAIKRMPQGGITVRHLVCRALVQEASEAGKSPSQQEFRQFARLR